MSTLMHVFLNQKNILFGSIFLLIISSTLHSQSIINNLDSIPNQKDLKVGLVLSGGGAKGLAHIGVLKVLEKSGVRIDYIGGTSMGAVIGSLYASGYSATALDSIFRRLDYDRLIQDELPRKAKTFYERDDSEKYAITLPFDGFKVGLPRGLSTGQNFFNEFAKFTSHVHHVNDFSKLPIPFFCVSTDMATGAEIIMDKGYLPDAVSASAALPSIFEPVELNKRLLTDGGVANNYPIEEIKKRGAELVIGVDVQDSLIPKDQLNSVTNILLQISNFRTIEDMESKKPQTDIYIKPNVTDFSALSFDQFDRIITTGEAAGLEVFEQLNKVKQQQSSGPKKIDPPSINDSFLIKALGLKGNDRYTRSYIKGKLKLKTPKRTNIDQLYEGINNLSATGNFDRVSHRLVDHQGSKNLMLNVKESENKMLLRFGLHYDDLFRSAVLLNYTQKSLFTNNDVLSFDVGLGDNLRYDLEYYIDKGFYWSVGVSSSLNQFSKNLDYELVREDFGLPAIELNKINFDFFDFKAQFYLETLLKQTFSLGIGLEYRRFRLISETLGTDEDELPRSVFDNSNYGSVFSYLRYDSYDNKYFPSSGFLLDANVNYYPFDNNPNSLNSNFLITKLNFGYAFKLLNTTSLQLQLGGGARIGAENLRSLNFFVGGFGAKTVASTIPFYGYDFLNIVGDSYTKAGATFNYEFAKKNHFNISANYANVGTKVFKSGQWYNIPEFSGYALGYGLDTFAGPMQVKYSYSPERKESQWFFSLGFWF